MTSARARRAVLGAALLTLVACQPMPHPFETEDKGNNPLLDLKEGVGVTVMPVTGVPPAFGERLSAALAGALRDAEVPAAVDVGNRGSFVVRGTARLANDAPGPVLELEWDVADGTGAVIGRIALRESVPATALDADSSGAAPGRLAALAKRGADKLVPLVRDDMPAQAPTAIAIGGIAGAPGDGAISLRRAVEFVLTQSDIPVAGPDRTNTLSLTASIEVGHPADGQQKVAIRWVLKLPDGREIGDVRQENAVPAGSLDRAWGNTALLVAEAAYEGIVALYEKAPVILAQ